MIVSRTTPAAYGGLQSSLQSFPWGPWACGSTSTHATRQSYPSIPTSSSPQWYVCAPAFAFLLPYLVGRWKHDLTIQFLQILSAILLCVATRHGLGRHVACVEEKDFIVAADLILASLFITNLNVALSKWAIACTLLRFTRERWYRYVVLMLVTIVTLLQLSWANIALTECHPPKDDGTPWNPKEAICTKWELMQFFGFSATGKTSLSP